MRQKVSKHSSVTVPMRVGIVGCGLVADNHVRALRHVKQAEVIAVCDRSLETASKLARTHKIPSVHTDLRTMLAKEHLDAVHVTTPPRTHEALCGLILEHGGHILVEKPVALSVAELDNMLGLAKSKGLTLSVVHNGLFQRAFHQALVAIRSGAIGELRSVHITDHIPSGYNIVVNKDHWCHGLPGGVYGELLPHDVYLAEALVPNLRVTNVKACGSGRLPWVPREQVYVSLSSDTAVVTMHASVDGGVWSKAIDVTGTTGSIRIDRMCDIVTNLSPAADWTLRPHVYRVLSTVGAWMQQAATTAARRLAVQPVSGHDTLIQGFYSALSTGAPPPVSDTSMRQTTALYEELMTAIDNDVASST